MTIDHDRFKLLIHAYVDGELEIGRFIGSP
jgi:hypothetical protein